MENKVAYKILKEMCLDEFKKDSLYGVIEYLSVSSNDRTATLDGEFTPDELEAIALWMRNSDAVFKGNE